MDEPQWKSDRFNVKERQSKTCVLFLVLHFYKHIFWKFEVYYKWARLITANKCIAMDQRIYKEGN